MREKEKILNTNQQSNNKEKWTKLSGNLSIYIDVWCSLNGRFQQRMFNSSIDMLTVDWHPFKPVSFLMPLLTEYNSYRYVSIYIVLDLSRIQNKILNTSKCTLMINYTVKNNKKRVILIFYAFQI